MDKTSRVQKGPKRDIVSAKIYGSLVLSNQEKFEDHFIKAHSLFWGGDIKFFAEGGGVEMLYR